MKQLIEYCDKYIYMIEKEIIENNLNPNESRIFKEVLNHRFLFEELISTYKLYHPIKSKKLNIEVLEFITQRKLMVNITSIQSLYKTSIDWLFKYDKIFLKKYLIQQSLAKRLKKKQ